MHTENKHELELEHELSIVVTNTTDTFSHFVTRANVSISITV